MNVPENMPVPHKITSSQPGHSMSIASQNNFSELCCTVAAAQSHSFLEHDVCCLCFLHAFIYGNHLWIANAHEIIFESNVVPFDDAVGPTN